MAGVGRAIAAGAPTRCSARNAEGRLMLLVWIAVAGGLVLFWSVTVFACNLVIVAKNTIAERLKSPL